MNKDTKIYCNNLYWLMDQPLMLKMDLLQYHLNPAQSFVNQFLDEEITHLAGDRYSLDHRLYSRYNCHHGSVRSGKIRSQLKYPE